MASEKINDQINKIPKEPGVYIFRDRSEKIIYIGKAINLRNRVRSYWNESSWSDRPKLKVMVPKVTDIETIITKSEKEALILESNLVFKHQPRYNVLLKDNKTFPWLVITYDEPYPRLIPVRSVDKFKKRCAHNSKNKYFGPYTNVGAMYENLTLVLELFPLRRKRVPPFKNRPCLNYDLGKCLGPCQKLISEEDYQAMLDQVEMLLKGDFQHLMDLIEEEMLRASDNLEFEKAAKYRDRLKALNTFNEKQNVISADYRLDQDVFALITDKVNETCCIQVFKSRAGKVVNRDTLEIEFNINDSEAEIFQYAFMQYYSQVPDKELPKEIITSHKLLSENSFLEIADNGSENHENQTFEDWLSERKGSKVEIITPKRGDKYSQVELAKRNGLVILERIKLERMEEASKNINVALANLQRELDLRSEPARIECFDISHIQGSDTVASMVCFIDGLPEKNEYRKFKISQDQNDDFASMREVVTRRYTKAVEKGDVPNLIIIDGGKGQLSSAKEILNELELSHIAVVGLAKKEEELFLPGESRPVVLDRKSPELFLIQRIRNEAHRFAVSYHRQLRSKRSLKSALDYIPGLGPAKKKILLDHFGTLSKIKSASIEEISELRGFSKQLAEKILQNL